MPLLLDFLHAVESAASLEPFNLGLVEGVVQCNSLLASILMCDDTFDGLQ